MLPDKPMTDVNELRCAHLINTCDYVLDIVPALEDQIKDKIDQAYIDRVDLVNHAEN